MTEKKNIWNSEHTKFYIVGLPVIMKLYDPIYNGLDNVVKYNIYYDP